LELNPRPRVVSNSLALELDLTLGDPGGPPLDELIARERPPVTTHFTEGALQEHAKHLKPKPEQEAG
jgi:hypothetical protein